MNRFSNFGLCAAAFMLSLMTSTSAFTATCDIFQRTHGSNYRLAKPNKQVEMGQSIERVPNRIYFLQKDADGKLAIVGLLYPLGYLEGGKFGDPAYVVAVGSDSAVTLVDYSAETQITCKNQQLKVADLMWELSQKSLKFEELFRSNGKLLKKRAAIENTFFGHDYFFNDQFSGPGENTHKYH